MGVDQPAVLGQRALQIEHMPGPRRAGDDPPVAGIGGDRAAILLAEADKRVFAGQDRAVRVGGHGSLPRLRQSPMLEHARYAMLGSPYNRDRLADHDQGARLPQTGPWAAAPAPRSTA